ncbi:UbiE family methyltransferase [Mycena rebaudengoi]|nr:UbiE family methyltransferase [Mycena rebaudengoi]
MTARYTHGHHESVLRSHTWRTADNSAAYLLSSLERNMHILDVGCGPGTITADLAKRVPDGHVTGIDAAKEILQQARDTAVAKGVDNITFTVGDVLALDYPDDSFDVVHAHQVLQHVSNPVAALREMIRVTKPGGIVAVRDTDFEAMTWFPENSGLSEWLIKYQEVARSNGGEPNSGRRLVSWAMEAGLQRKQITATAGTWCYSTPEDVEWWSSLWADRIVASSFATSALARGLATQETLDHLAQSWKSWGKEPDAWFAVLHGEILCRV